MPHLARQANVPPVGDGVGERVFSRDQRKAVLPEIASQHRLFYSSPRDERPASSLTPLINPVISMTNPLECSAIKTEKRDHQAPRSDDARNSPVYTITAGTKLTKYSSNGVLSRCVSFSNEIGGISKRSTDTDINPVAEQLHTDKYVR